MSESARKGARSKQGCTGASEANQLGRRGTGLESVNLRKWSAWSRSPAASSGCPLSQMWSKGAPWFRARGQNLRTWSLPAFVLCLSLD